jgi:hypothetical protein
MAERPAPSPVPARGIEAIAVENVTEGCVHELYAALVATWVSRHARSHHVRAQMVGIARDETRQAALSLEVASWLHASSPRASSHRPTSRVRGWARAGRVELSAAVRSRST